MFIVIDKGRLGFLPIKFNDLAVVCDLICLEAPNEKVYVNRLDHNFLNHFTDLELMLLYKNTTGEQAIRVGDSLRNILFELANRIEVRKVNGFELFLQVKTIPERTSKRYMYASGSQVPTEKENTFRLDIVKLAKAPNELDIAKIARSSTPSAPRTG